MTTSPASAVLLRDVTPDDLLILFAYSREPEASFMAAFGPPGVVDQEAFTARWATRLADDSRVNKVIVFEGHVVGSISSFEMLGDPHIGYSIGKAYWGQGITSQALAMFLPYITVRPLYARIAHDNDRSRRVLQKNGFVVVGRDTAFANFRGAEMEENILRLD